MLNETKRYTWWRAVAVAALVVYGPFLLMALIASSTANTDHIRNTAWQVVPAGPCLLGVEMVVHGMRLTQFPQSPHLLASTVFSCAVMLGAAQISRGQVKSRILILTAVALWSCFMAVATLAVIRS